MFVINFFRDVLGYLGLYKKNGKILFLGLDNAGKSTLLARLKNDKMTQMDPTTHAKSEELVIGNVRFKAFDLGGHFAARKAWKNYFPTVNGIIYMVDSAAGERFEESREELMKIMSSPELENVPLIILGNKIDLDNAVGEDELRMAHGLASKTSFGVEKKSEFDGRPCEVFMCSVAKKTGYAEGFRWLSQFLK